MNKRSITVNNAADCTTAPELFVNIAAYRFTALDELQTLRDRLRQVCHRNGLRGTILLSSEGINLFLAGYRAGIDDFLSELGACEALKDLDVKESFSLEQPFNRMLVKLKREIIAFGVESVAPAERTSPKLSAEELKRWLDEGRPVRLLDTRNDYEVDLGTFRGAERLGLRNFRDFPEAAARILPEHAKDQPLVMFCTGGIRCEKAGPLLEQLGFRHVYQLDGGILKYFEQCGDAHYEGGCFVFDSRVVLNSHLQPTGAVLCFQCQAVLTHQDIQSPLFQFGRSCPHCHRTGDEQRQDQLGQRQSAISRIAALAPGLHPYDHRRRMHVASRWSGLSVIDFLCAFNPRIGRQDWLQWIDQGQITSGGKSCLAEDLVREGQQFEQIQRGVTEPAVASSIRLIWEDASLIVIDKPAPLPVHASGRFLRHTLLHVLSEAYRPEKLRLAHRIDANTTGIVVFCRKYAAARVVQPQFASGQVQKKYLLRVLGHPSQDAWQCDAPIGEEPVATGARLVRESGRSATTQFRVLNRMTDGTALLEATPLTGRTHQIRVHAWHDGWSIIGDPLYLPGGRLGNQQTLAVDAPPMCLHAWKLSLLHPEDGRAMHWQADLPNWAVAASQ